MDTHSPINSAQPQPPSSYRFVLLLTGIRCQLRIGVLEQERGIPQLVVIDAELSIHTTQLSLAHMPDYAAVTKLILATVEEQQSWVLVEEVAALLAEKLGTLQGVTGGWVWVAKPDALRGMLPVSAESAESAMSAAAAAAATGHQEPAPLARIRWPVVPTTQQKQQRR